MSQQPEHHLETNIKQQALTKLKQEICKNIENVKKLCKYTTLNELLQIMWYVHVCRIASNYTNEIIGNEIEKNNPDLVKIYCFRLEDTFKYIISSMVKFGCKNKDHYTVNNLNNLEISGQDLIGYLIKEVNIINSKQEVITLIDLFDIEFYQEKSGIIKINFNSLNSNFQKNIFSEYFRRLAQDNFKAYQAQKSYQDFLNKFKNEYIQYSDLFEEVFKISLENFVEFIQYILDTITQTFQDTLREYVSTDSNYIFKLEDQRVYMCYWYSIGIISSSIKEKFGSKIFALIEKLTFKPDQFDENEIRYHLLSRTPIIKVSSETFLCSPQLILDSLYINTNYSLLENQETKEKYKARSSEVFVNKIIEICNKFGYKKERLEVELRKGKKQLGDIDIILKNDENHYLLIEAKNHALPLDVYFGNIEATQKHLQKLKDWDKKVSQRQEHLNNHYNDYGISKSFRYIIVSLRPEIISHYSEHIVVSIRELEDWLKLNCVNFNELFKQIYDDTISLSEQDLEHLRHDGFSILNTAPLPDLETN